uniref:(northern house mosquito) hypothetical protein n=1 Tax=Culex pipiens TaxID=7175 RepID=A0A8D8NEB4_CULPI
MARDQVDCIDWSYLCTVHQLVGSNVPAATCSVCYVFGRYHLQETSYGAPQDANSGAGDNPRRTVGRYDGAAIQPAPADRYDVHRNVACLHDRRGQCACAAVPGRHVAADYGSQRHAARCVQADVQRGQTEGTEQAVVEHRQGWNLCVCCSRLRRLRNPRVGRRPSVCR